MEMWDPPIYSSFCPDELSGLRNDPHDDSAKTFDGDGKQASLIVHSTRVIFEVLLHPATLKICRGISESIKIYRANPKMHYFYAFLQKLYIHTYYQCSSS